MSAPYLASRLTPINPVFSNDPFSFFKERFFSAPIDWTTHGIPSQRKLPICKQLTVVTGKEPPSPRTWPTVWRPNVAAKGGSIRHIGAPVSTTHQVVFEPLT